MIWINSAADSGRHKGLVRCRPSLPNPRCQNCELPSVTSLGMGIAPAATLHWPGLFLWLQRRLSTQTCRPPSTHCGHSACSPMLGSDGTFRAFKWENGDVTKPKAWRMEVGMALGFLVGGLLWWSAYEPGGGLFQNLKLVFFPPAIGVFIVGFRNRRAKVGPYDPEVIAENRRGRV